MHRLGELGLPERELVGRASRAVDVSVAPGLSSAPSNLAVPQVGDRASDLRCTVLVLALSFVEPFDAAHLSALSPDRRLACLRLLRNFDPWLSAAAPTLGDAEALRWFLKRQLDDGYSAATVRKHLAMIRVFFDWGYEHQRVDAATLLAVRAVRLPVTSSREAAPVTKQSGGSINGEHRSRRGNHRLKNALWLSSA